LLRLLNSLLVGCYYSSHANLLDVVDRRM